MLSIQFDTDKSLKLVIYHQFNNIKLSFFASHMKSSIPLCTFLIDAVRLLDTLYLEIVIEKTHLWLSVLLLIETWMKGKIPKSFIIPFFLAARHRHRANTIMLSSKKKKGLFMVIYVTSPWLAEGGVNLEIGWPQRRRFPFSSKQLFYGLQGGLKVLLITLLWCELEDWERS